MDERREVYTANWHEVDDGRRPTAPRPDPFSRSVRLWLRAYPVRWRAARGEELLGVLRDLAGPDATRLTLREGLGLVRAGWATRWRSGPPLLTRLTYHLFERRIPAAYRQWARDDIDGRWYSMRAGLWSSALPVPIVTMLATLILGQGALPWIWSVAFVIVSCATDMIPRTARHRREQAVRRHLAARPGDFSTALPV